MLSIAGHPGRCQKLTQSQELVTRPQDGAEDNALGTDEGQVTLERVAAIDSMAREPHVHPKGPGGLTERS
jgi:hypothetical protein